MIKILIAASHFCYLCYLPPPPPPPCDTGVSLQTQAEATTPADRSRTKLGVGERVTLSLNPAPPCGVTWSKSGNGSLSATSGSSITFTAHDRASTATVTATINGAQRSVTFNVVEPVNETGVKLWELTNYEPGELGAGMFLGTTMHPTDVSFDNLEITEVAGVGTNKMGYFTQFNFVHNTVGWADVLPGNFGEDTVDFRLPSNVPRPLSPGSFQFDIPVRWRVPTGQSGEAPLPNVVQFHSLNDAGGSITSSKFGQSVTRTP